MDKCALISSCNYWWCQRHNQCLEYALSKRGKPNSFKLKSNIGREISPSEIVKGRLAKRLGFETDITVHGYHYIQCHYCGFWIPLNRITRDHKFPRSKGGKGNKDNIVPACHACNCDKGSTPYGEYLQQRFFRNKPMSAVALAEAEDIIKNLSPKICTSNQ